MPPKSADETVCCKIDAELQRGILTEISFMKH